MSAPLLALRDVCVDFPSRHGTRRALDGVTLDIGPGEILGVVGESGAGKSLTGAAIVGLVEPPGHVAHGEILFEGRRIDDLRPAALRRLRGKAIGSIFQDPATALDPLQTAGAQLVETLRVHLPLGRAAARERAIELLGQAGIAAPAQRFDQYPHQLSGGLRQRVVIALALAGEPRLLIADEPTTALDVAVQAQILALLRGISQARGMAVMLISHDLAAVAATCDRIAVMYAGRVVEAGPVQELVRRPAHPYTASLMACLPTLADAGARLAQIPGALPREGAIPAGCSFHPRCPKASPRCEAERPPLALVRRTRAACWWPLTPVQETA